jgi:hypothetical protein
LDIETKIFESFDLSLDKETGDKDIKSMTSLIAEGRDTTYLCMPKFLGSLVLTCYSQEGYTLARELFMDNLQYFNESDSG